MRHRSTHSMLLRGAIGLDLGVPYGVLGSLNAFKNCLTLPHTWHTPILVGPAGASIFQRWIQVTAPLIVLPTEQPLPVLSPVAFGCGSSIAPVTVALDAPYRRGRPRCSLALVAAAP